MGLMAIQIGGKKTLHGVVYSKEFCCDFTASLAARIYLMLVQALGMKMLRTIDNPQYKVGHPCST